MADIQALRETMKMVEAAAEKGLWDQDVWLSSHRTTPDGDRYELVRPTQVTAPDGHTWTCGTAGCFAGWRAMMDGLMPDVASQRVRDPRTGMNHRVASYAQARLDLTDEQADILFDGYNGLVDLRDIVESIAEGRL